MSPSFHRITYDTILDQLGDTNRWLQEVNIDTRNSRLSEITEYMEIICDHHKRNDVENLIENYDNEILWYATLETGAFLDIHRAFHDMESRLIPRGKLKNILQGPFLPRHEDPMVQNIHARNTLFELQIAAKIKNAGIEVLGFDDVDFVFEGIQFNAQCKRIHSSKMVEENVGKAFEQAARKMNEAGNINGLVCLSIDKLVEKDDKILRVKTADGIQHEMTRITSDFIDQNCHYWKKTLNIKMIACLIYFQAAAIIEDQNLLTRCQQLEIDPIAIPENLQAAGYSIIEDFVKVLSRQVP